MLGQLTGKEKPHGSLNLAGGDGGPLVVMGELGGLSGDPLEDVVNERVHDAHCLRRDAGVGMDLLQNFVDVNGVRLLPLLSLGPLLASGFPFGLRSISGGVSLAHLLHGFTSLRRHL